VCIYTCSEVDVCSLYMHPRERESAMKNNYVGGIYMCASVRVFMSVRMCTSTRMHTRMHV
jgi:hypothetical protein